MHIVKNSAKPISDDQQLSSRLAHIRQNIQSDALTEFVNVLFDNEVFYEAFTTCPASVKHHHCVLGGLLQHSVEAAEYAYNQHYHSAHERDITVVAALLHDVGKVKTYTPSGYLSTLGKLVNHDDMTLEVCADSLKQLDQVWPDAALTLRHIWTCASPGARYGHSIASPLVHIVRTADRVSVDNDMQNKVFDEQQIKTGCAWSDGTYYWKAQQEKRKHVWKF